MPTGRANARPMTGSASSGAIRVRGSRRTHLCSEFAETGPSPQPSPREERGEGEVVRRLDLNSSRSSRWLTLRSARGFERLRGVDIEKGAVTFDRDFRHRFAMPGNQMARADIAVQQIGRAHV